MFLVLPLLGACPRPEPVPAWPQWPTDAAELQELLGDAFDPALHRPWETRAVRFVRLRVDGDLRVRASGGRGWTSTSVPSPPVGVDWNPSWGPIELVQLTGRFTISPPRQPVSVIRIGGTNIVSSASCVYEPPNQVVVTLELERGRRTAGDRPLVCGVAGVLFSFDLVVAQPSKP